MPPRAGQAIGPFDQQRAVARQIVEPELAYVRTFLQAVEIDMRHGQTRLGRRIGDWLSANAGTASAATPAVAPSFAAIPGRRADTLNGKEKRELDELPARIEKLEAEQEKLTAELPGLYASDAAKARAAQERLTQAATTGR